MQNGKADDLVDQQSATVSNSASRRAKVSFLNCER
jgi:hypothetical protein